MHGDDERRQPGEPRASPLVEQWTELTFAMRSIEILEKTKTKRKRKKRVGFIKVKEKVGFVQWEYENQGEEEEEEGVKIETWWNKTFVGDQMWNDEMKREQGWGGNEKYYGLGWTGIGKENWGEKNFLEVGMAFLKDCVSIRYHILSVLHSLQFIFQCPVRPYVLPFLQSSVPLIVGQIQM